eukprot:5032767-Amphidinium_carterae.1
MKRPLELESLEPEERSREAVLEAVKANGRYLSYASEELRGDREIVLAAVTQHGMSLSHASEQLRGDREIVLAAVARNPHALSVAAQVLKSDKFVVLHAIRADWSTVVHTTLRGDREIITAAAGANARALSFADDTLLGDTSFEAERKREGYIFEVALLSGVVTRVFAMAEEVDARRTYTFAHLMHSVELRFRGMGVSVYATANDVLMHEGVVLSNTALVRTMPGLRRGEITHLSLVMLRGVD